MNGGEGMEPTSARDFRARHRGRRAGVRSRLRTEKDALSGCSRRVCSDVADVGAGSTTKEDGGEGWGGSNGRVGGLHGKSCPMRSSNYISFTKGA